MCQCVNMLQKDNTSLKTIVKPPHKCIILPDWSLQSCGSDCNVFTLGKDALDVKCKHSNFIR